jgi:hypothetical protein
MEDNPKPMEKIFFLWVLDYLPSAYCQWMLACFL